MSSSMTSTIAPATSIPFKRDASLAGDGSGDALAFWVVAVLALLVMGWGIKKNMSRQRFGQLLGKLTTTAETRKIELCDKMQLTPHVSLHVVRWGGEEILLSCHAQSLSVLGRKSAQAGAAVNPKLDSLSDGHVDE